MVLEDKTHGHHGSLDGPNSSNSARNARNNRTSHGWRPGTNDSSKRLLKRASPWPVTWRKFRCVWLGKVIGEADWLVGDESYKCKSLYFFLLGRLISVINQLNCRFVVLTIWLLYGMSFFTVPIWERFTLGEVNRQSDAVMIPLGTSNSMLQPSMVHHALPPQMY